MIASASLVRRFRKEWKMPKGLFLRAGLALLVIELFHFSVMDSALSRWQELFLSQHVVVQALLFGLMAGLFFELGRFFVLDKLFKHVRSQKEGLYFAMGWRGVEMFAFGFLIVAGSYGIYLLATTPDLATLYPDASTTELQQLGEYKGVAEDLYGTFPLYGLTPLVEYGALLLLDMFLTLVVLLRFTRGSNRYVWLAVLVHGLFAAALFTAQQFEPYVPLLVLVLLGGASYRGMKYVQSNFGS